MSLLSIAPTNTLVNRLLWLLTLPGVQRGLIPNGPAGIPPADRRFRRKVPATVCSGSEDQSQRLRGSVAGILSFWSPTNIIDYTELSLPFPMADGLLPSLSRSPSLGNASTTPVLARPASCAPGSWTAGTAAPGT